MSFTTSFLPAICGCLLQAAFVSARPGIKIPIVIVINGTTIHTVAFSFLIIFAILTGLLFLGVFASACGAKEEFPPNTPPTKYATGILFKRLACIAVGVWLAQLILYTVYVRNIFMLKPRKDFSDSAFVARRTLDQFTDFFIAASILRLLYYRRNIHAGSIPSYPAWKKTLDASLLFLQFAAIVCTTVFLALSTNDPASDSKFVNWLASLHAYTVVYIPGVLNVVITTWLFRKSLKESVIMDEPLKRMASIPGSLIVHALYKMVICIVFSQYKNDSINYDILRLFEVLVQGITYFIVMLGLSLVGAKSEEDDKIMKALKEKAKQEKAHEHE